MTDNPNALLPLPGSTEAVREAARSVQKLTGLPLGSCYRVIRESRLDLLPSDPDVAWLDTLDGDGQLSLEEVVRAVVADHFATDERAELDTVVMLIADTVSAWRYGDVLEFALSPAHPDHPGAAAHMTGDDWSVVRVTVATDGDAGEATVELLDTGLPAGCPNPARVAVAIEALTGPAASTDTATPTEEEVSAELVARGHRSYVSLGRVVVPYATSEGLFEGEVNLAGQTMRVYRPGDIDKLYTLGVEPDDPASAGSWADAIVSAVDFEQDEPTEDVPAQVWVLAIEHRHGTDTTVHTSETGATAALARYVRGEWKAERDRGAELPASPPSDDGEAIDVYFEAVHWEGYDIREAALQD